MLKNLFHLKGIGPLLRRRWPWRLLHLAGLVVLLLMAAYGWHHHAVPGVKVKDPLMYTNLATSLFWVVWIMGVVFFALIGGRLWCTVCPLGWFTGLFTRIGLKRPLPRWLDNHVTVTLTLVALQLGVYFFAIHRYPDYTARLLALMLLLAIGCGLLFRRRAFCSLFCPAGAVFGLYARLAPLSLRVRDDDVCAGCSGKECVSGAPFWSRFSLGSVTLFWKKERPDCPVGLAHDELGENPTCSLCLHCAQNCPYDNLDWGTRPWLSELFGARLKPSETFFFLVLLGMLTANFSKVYVDLRELILWLPDQTAQLLGWSGGGYSLLAALWVTLGLPLLIMLPGLLLQQLLRLKREVVSDPTLAPAPPASIDRGESLGARLGRLALPCVPMILAAHLALAVVKLNAKLGYLPFAFRDPTGVKSYLAMNVMQTVAAPGVLIPLDILKWLVLALLLLGYGVSLRAASRLAAGVAAAERTPLLFASWLTVTVPALLYGATVIRWLFIR